MSDIFRDMSFGGLLKEERIKHKLTMRQASSAFMMSVSNYSKMEASKYPPPDEGGFIKMACNALGIECTEFLLWQAYSWHCGHLNERFWYNSRQ